MEHFEDQLRTAAQRRAQQQDSELRLPRNPRSPHHTHGQWLGTVAAILLAFVAGFALRPAASSLLGGTGKGAAPSHLAALDTPNKQGDAHDKREDAHSKQGDILNGKGDALAPKGDVAGTKGVAAGIERVVRDTLYLTRIEKKRILVHDTVYLRAPKQQTPPTLFTSVSLAMPEQCTSVMCDSINYALMIPN